MNFEIETKGHGDVVDLTAQVARLIKSSGVGDGLAVVFVSGSTAAITTMENESGLIEDLKRVLLGLAPEGRDYLHHRRWGDHNGNAHILAAIIGPSVALPVSGGEPSLGDWQQVVLIDFDERPRTRRVEVAVSPAAPGR